MKRPRLLLLLLVPLCIAAFYCGLTVTEYEITSDEITHPVRILLLTDLHSCRYRNLVETIHARQPDIVLMSGDMMDDKIPDTQTIALLEGIAADYPCYYVTGNHEFWSGRVDAQKEILRTYGVTVLEGEGVTLSNSIALYGIDDPAGGKENFERQFAAVSNAVHPAQYSILLSHRPEYFNRYTSTHFDLVLCGHTHGGQWRLPLLLPNGLVAPNQGIFPRYTNGTFSENGTTMLVSRGLARETTLVPRIFNPPELVLITLKPN